MNAMQIAIVAAIQLAADCPGGGQPPLTEEEACANAVRLCRIASKAAREEDAREIAELESEGAAK